MRGRFTRAARPLAIALALVTLAAAVHAQQREERRSEIRAAVRYLEQAGDTLQKGPRDATGRRDGDSHREKALDLVNQALDECRQSLESKQR